MVGTYSGLQQSALNPVQRDAEADISYRIENPGEAQESAMQQARLGGKWFLTGLLTTGVVLMLCLYGTGNLGGPKAAVKQSVMFDVTMAGTENADKLPSCSWATDAFWHPLTSADERAIPAVKNAFSLASAKRAKDCKPALGDLDWDPANFVEDVASDFHVEMRQKFSGDCSGESYNLKFSISNVQTFEITTHKDRLTGVWTLLQSSPNVCKINVETSSAPRRAPVDDPDVKKAAEFAIGELTLRSTSKDCLNTDKEVKLLAITAATTQVMAGVKYNIIASVLYNRVKYPSTTLKVLERCGDSLDRCFLQLELPDGVEDFCKEDDFKKIFLAGSSPSRRLGATEEDHGESFVAQKRMLYPRRLGDDSKDPLRERYMTSLEGGVGEKDIATNVEKAKALDSDIENCGVKCNAAMCLDGGKYKDEIDIEECYCDDDFCANFGTQPVPEVPETFDPAKEEFYGECLEAVPVYQEGECASCYANAYASMMGQRACIQAGKVKKVKSEKKDKTKKEKKAKKAKKKEKKAKEKAASEPAPSPPPSDDRRMAELDEDLEQDEYDGESSRLLSTKEGQSPARQLGDCEDDPAWHAFGAEMINCAFFEKHGCAGYNDFGQLTHCKATCKVCEAAEAGDNPYADAAYKFMPSVNDLATCSTGPTGDARGCNGGNMWEMWNNYLSTSKRPMSIMGKACQPYTLKCFFGAEVMNPMRSDDACDTFSGFDTWDKPCSCIDDDKKDTEATGLPTCPDSVDPACEFPVPYAAFVVLGHAGGLSVEDAVLNYQRHVVEYGPVYVTILTTSKFIDWDWEAAPIYTGAVGGLAMGGHAMIITGWGAGAAPYWIVRNSWGATWANKGSCFFLRGANLDGIENHGGVTMPVADFKDFSAPICRITSWRREWAYEGKVLYSYTLYTKFRCNEKAKIKVFFSTIVTGARSKIQKGISGLDKDLEGGDFVPKQTEVEADIAMTLLNFGIEGGDMWIQITAEDEAGNSQVTTNFLSIPKVPGMVDIQSV